MENNNGAKAGVNWTIVVVAILVCATVLGGLYIISDGVAKGKSAQVESASRFPAAPAAPGVVEKGLAVAGLQKAEGGPASSAYYTKFLTEQVYCQMVAGTIRSIVEKVDIAPTQDPTLNVKFPSKNIPGVRKGLEIAASYYRRSVRNKLSLSSAGIDDSVVSYVEKFASYDEATAQAYEEYARTLVNQSGQITAIGNERDALVAQQEPGLAAAFQSKFGLKLPTRQQIREDVIRTATAESRDFIDKKTPQDLAANLLGQSLFNVNGISNWTVEPGEYVYGRVIDSSAGAGVASVDLEVQLKGARSGNAGLVRARIVYVKDPVRNVYWVILVQDLSR